MCVQIGKIRPTCLVMFRKHDAICRRPSELKGRQGSNRHFAATESWKRQ